jgi:hypothetical protein
MNVAEDETLADATLAELRSYKRLVPDDPLLTTYVPSKVSSTPKIANVSPTVSP